jgi:hypothetical protein
MIKRLQVISTSGNVNRTHLSLLTPKIGVGKGLTC